MTTPEQPTPPMTRRQIRELRNTAANPIIVPDEPVVDEPPVVAAPLPRPAEPVVVPPPPVADASVDLGVNPLTRRQARQQERIRTASVPVITPDLLSAHTSEFSAPIAVQPTSPLTAVAEREAQPVDDAADEPADAEFAAVLAEAAAESDVDEEDEIRPIVSSALGADLLTGPAAAAEAPPSFDQLLTRDSATTGSIGVPNALILTQTPESGPLLAPVAATGEALITGTFALPEGLGSNGHAPGAADGKDIDVSLVGGELPPASSPTPIAASAAVSTIKSAAEIIQPPAPEKGGKLMLVLAITAGALALALVGVLVFAIATGVFA